MDGRFGQLAGARLQRYRVAIAGRAPLRAHQPAVHLIY